MWVSRDASGGENVTIETIAAPADQQGAWWHVGYITMAGGVPTLEV